MGTLTKLCTKCGLEQDLDNFYIELKAGDGHQKYCIPCQKRLVRASVLKRQSYYKEQQRIRNLAQYGLSLEKYQDLVQKQENRCKICGVVQDLVVDHNHETGQFRGLLCISCNAGLGFFKDDPEFLLYAHKYLLDFKGKAEGFGG